MSCFAYDLMGVVVHSPSKEKIQSLLSSVCSADDEHPDVSLNTDEGWSLSYSKAATLSFENVETGEGPWHMTAVSTDKALSLWLMLSECDVDDMKSEAWMEGYAP